MFTLRLSRAAIAVLVTSLAMIVLASTGSPASAAIDVDRVAAQMRINTVVNDPSAERALTPSEVSQLKIDIAQTGQLAPFYHIAVLPASALSDEYPTANDLLAALQASVADEGIYALVVGDDFRAGSTESSVSDIATSAINEYGSEGTYMTLLAFVAGTSERFGGEVPTAYEQATQAGFPVGLALGLGLLVLIGSFLLFRTRRKAKQRTQKEVAEVRGVLDEDVTEYGERLAQYDMRDPALDEQARDDLTQALDSYEKAKKELGAMTSSDDAAKVTNNLEDGRYALACVSARMNGEPIPDRRPPCFVDPRHGPSSEDLMYTPSGAAAARETPVCPLCANTIRQGGDPAPLQVPVHGGTRVPYWEAGRQYAPYANGYYQSFGNVLPAVLVGTMMGSMFGGGAHTANADAYGGGFGEPFGGGGDIFGGGGGGGGWGGDFGGGGGDFGGGGF